MVGWRSSNTITMPTRLEATDRAADSTITYMNGAWAHANTAYLTAVNTLNSLSNFANLDPVDVNIDWVDISPPEKYQIGVLPTEPALNIGSLAINFDYIPTGWAQFLQNELVAKLTLLIQGETGLSAVIENEIYDRESERDTRGTADAQDRIATRWSESGFVLPDGILAAMTSWADIEYQNKYSDKSRKIAEDSFKIGIENVRFGVGAGTKLEDLLRQACLGDNKLKIDAAKAIMEAGIAIYDAQIKGQIANVELYKASSQAYEANAKAIGALSQADVALYAAQTASNEARATVTAKQIELQIKQAELQVSISSDIARSIADVASRLANGAMSSINSGSSIGWSGSDSNSISTSGSVSQSASSSDSSSYILSETAE